MPSKKLPTGFLELATVFLDYSIPYKKPETVLIQNYSAIALILDFINYSSQKRPDSWHHRKKEVN
jgi:hypothetical protein